MGLACYQSAPVIKLNWGKLSRGYLKRNASHKQSCNNLPHHLNSPSGLGLKKVDSKLLKSESYPLILNYALCQRMHFFPLKKKKILRFGLLLSYLTVSVSPSLPAIPLPPAPTPALSLVWVLGDGAWCLVECSINKCPHLEMLISLMTPLKFPSENPLRVFVVLFCLFSLLSFSCIKVIFKVLGYNKRQHS